LSWTGEVEVEVAASPDRVWEVLSDITRVGEWSHECHTAVWRPGHEGLVVGAEFTGSNRNGFMRWARRCTITEAVPRRVLAYRTSGGFPPDSTEWRFELMPDDTGGSRIRQTFHILRMPRVTELAIVLMMPAHHDRRPALAADLVRLGEVAGAARPTT
jgi:uncharacterized protein YndB with AHSA1/START domain